MTISDIRGSLGAACGLVLTAAALLTMPASAQECHFSELSVGCNDGDCFVGGSMSGVPANVASIKYYVFFHGTVTRETENRDGESRTSSREVPGSLSGTFMLPANHGDASTPVYFEARGTIGFFKGNSRVSEYWEDSPVYDSGQCFLGATYEGLRKARAAAEAADKAAAEAAAVEAQRKAAALRAANPLADLGVSGIVAPPRQLAHGSSLHDCNDCPEMVVIQGASFTMGSPPWEVARIADEGPQRRVAIEPFAVGKNEVTFADWDACVAAGGCKRYQPDDGGWGHGLQPVINISWDDANSYAEWLSRKTGQVYRLLTEAEWEYAARAGTSGPFAFGASTSGSAANFDAAYPYNGGTQGVARGRPSPVGSYPANPFGLNDMNGNVWEWVQDCYAASYGAGQPGNGSAYSREGCPSHVYRGGSWDSSAGMTRSASRNKKQPKFRDKTLGFRLARSLG